MKASKMSKYFIPCLTVLAASISQAYASDESANVVSGEVTPKLIYFNYNGGPGGGSPQYLQAFGSERGWSGNDNSGFYADLDVNLKIGDRFSLEREGFGRDSHRGNIQGGNSDLGFSGYYGHYRSGSSGLDYLNRPGTANNPVATGYTASGNGGYLTLFNDDTGGVTSYTVERTRYGVGVKFKPDLLGKNTSLSLNFDGYKRDGNKFATYVFGNGDVTPNSAAQKQARWRGYNMPVEENMGRFSLNFTTNPGGMFQFAYDGSIEKFRNQARTALATDFESQVEAVVGLTLAATNDMHFVPDSTLMTNAFRLSKTYGKTAIAVGYGMSRLDQDSFSNNQADPNSGYSKGKISTDNAFFNANHRLSSSVGIEGFVKYANRENDSSGGFAGAEMLDREVRDLWGVRIKDLESLNYGLAATFNGLPAKSSVTVGWKHLDTDRDLQYNTIPANGNLGAWPTVVMLQDRSKSDEIYLRWNARPMKDMTLRLTPSWVSASKTGYVTEAEDSFNLKAALGYALTKQAHVNAYYHYKDKKNGDQSFTDTTKPSGGVTFLGTSYQQKADDTFHAAGLSVNHSPSEWLNFSGSLDWAQNDFETYFFGTNARRFEQTIVFDPRGTSDYKVDTLSLSLNTDYQPTDQLKLRATYTWSDTSGDLDTTSTATLGLGAGGYSVNDKVDNTLHSLAFGLDYALKNKLTLKGAYVYDRYKDKAFSNLNGSHHTLMMGVSVGF
ncbi:MAG: MtrB/PioB family outer membrane beta-barrel protein [Rhodocyclaceae bacterium]|nr:MtrB/PioB family outer membrane beta-barrel protein [Rhodocyclaceae bacterium]